MAENTDRLAISNTVLTAAGVLIAFLTFLTALNIWGCLKRQRQNGNGRWTSMHMFFDPNDGTVRVFVDGQKRSV
ncbi:uncharacterized protein H6S33_003764 [Morchella sextelata]|uniref:uncharacterized protein n=1 Tax=Morchella sextelata TaxID=1174677 RepID=UPI001D0405E0|nr:uncharacterized protein H6S33_003764 [Morchella sextelata]KAH0606103.1 hypothetical protein H6S33_003764 [Morchella sextelata]